MILSDHDQPQTAYELSESQVTTPEPVSRFFWRLTINATTIDLSARYREPVIAGFAKVGSFDRYVGFEVDWTASPVPSHLRNGKVIHGCLFDTSDWLRCLHRESLRMRGTMI